MNRLIAEFGLAKTVSALFVLLALPAATWAQVPVDENGEIIGQVEVQSVEPATGEEDIPLLSTVDLEELVGPIALYPDDLLAIVLPAAAYPLQIVEVARFLEALEDDPSLEPNPEWDDSVVALTNYPEVVELLNDDIDWTWRLGEAVVSQQADVVAAIETFRDRAYAAGNLKSDSYQNVSRDEGVIEITPVADDVIYVPYYEPERVVVYQPRPVYYYYPRPYPVYYYPYSSSHAFHHGYFWGVTTAFTIGWYSDSLNVFHHSYHGHPYYGHSYWDRWWYRRPTINIYHNNYVGRDTTVTINRFNRGDRWRPRHNRRDYVSDRRVTRNRLYPGRRTANDTNRLPSVADNQSRTARRSVPRRAQDRDPITFRERRRTPTIARSDNADRRIRQANRRSGRISGTAGREPTARVAPRNTDNAARNRSEPQARTQKPQVRRVAPSERRSDPTTKPRRADTTTQVRRSEPARQVRRPETMTPPRRTERVRQLPRAEQAAQVRRSAPARESKQTSPARQARRAEPTRQVAAAPRQQKVQRKSPPSENSQKRDRQPKRRR